MMLEIIKNNCGWVCRKLNIVAYLTAENLALRQQLLMLERNRNRPKLKERDRLFWVIVSRICSGWRDALLIAQPDTVGRWHKRAFNFYWRRKSQTGKRGRPALDSDVKALILKMADANPLWGAPKIHGESLHRAASRKYSARVYRPCHCLRRKSSAQTTSVLFRVLSRGPNPLGS